MNSTASTIVLDQIYGPSCRNGSSLKIKTTKRICAVPRNYWLKGCMIQTFLAAESPVMAAELERTLPQDASISVVGSAADGWKALCYTSILRPDLVLASLHISGLDGADLANRLKQLANPPVVFIVTCDDSREARTRCLAAGAEAFLVIGANWSVQLETAIQKFVHPVLGRPNRVLRARSSRPLDQRRPNVSQPSGESRKNSHRRA